MAIDETKISINEVKARFVIQGLDLSAGGEINYHKPWDGTHNYLSHYVDTDNIMGVTVTRYPDDYETAAKRDQISNPSWPNPNSSSLKPIDAVIDMYKPEFHMPSIAFNSVNGTFWQRPICVKSKMTWHFEAINQVELNRLLYDKITTGNTLDTDRKPYFANSIIGGSSGKRGGIRGIIESNKCAFFFIRTKYEDTAKTYGLHYIETINNVKWYGSTFYYGDESNFEYSGQNTDGLAYYTGEIHWIEVAGDVLYGMTGGT